MSIGSIDVFTWKAMSMPAAAYFRIILRRPTIVVFTSFPSIRFVHAFCRTLFSLTSVIYFNRSVFPITTKQNVNGDSDESKQQKAEKHTI